MNHGVAGLLFVTAVLSAGARPGGTYKTTGRETSIFGIFQTDMKACPELYEGADVNACYKEFKELNDLAGGRKLRLGEELQFPHTPKSREMEEAERVAAERAARKAEQIAAQETAGAAGDETAPATGGGELFGADRRGAYEADLRREQARKNAVARFQEQSLNAWMFGQDGSSVQANGIDELIALARGRVDDAYAESIRLHRYPEKHLCVIEFEPPRQQGGYFFFALMTAEHEAPRFYSLEKGLTFFGAGEQSILKAWSSAAECTELGDREYTDLAGFVNDLQAGPRPE